MLRKQRCQNTATMLPLRKEAPGEDLGIQALSKRQNEIVIFLSRETRGRVLFLRKSYQSVSSKQKGMKRNQEKSNGCHHRDFGLRKEDCDGKGRWKRKNKEIPEGNHTVVLNWIQMAKETGG